MNNLNPAPAAVTAVAAAIAATGGIGNNMELDKNDQFIVAIDISASMQAKDGPAGLSRLDGCLETAKYFIGEANDWDPDGVSVYLFGERCHAFPDLTLADAQAKLVGITTEGATMTHLAIAAAYAEHKRKKNQQTFLLMFTDGEPSDRPAVQKAICDIANEVADEKEFRIQWLTVGAKNAALESYFNDLDNNLNKEINGKKPAKYDIINIRRLEGTDFISAIGSAIKG